MTPTIEIPDGVVLEPVRAGGIRVERGRVHSFRRGNLRLVDSGDHLKVTLVSPCSQVVETHLFFKEAGFCPNHGAYEAGEYYAQELSGPAVENLDEDEHELIRDTLTAAAN